MHIKTKRLLLLPLGPEFLETTHLYASDYENTKLMVHLPKDDISETKNFLDNVQAEWQKSYPEFYEFAILLNYTHIGAVSIYLQDDSSGEIGWIIRKEYWGNGYAKEAAREILSFAKEELKLSTVIAHCDSENIASYKLMEKLGMTLLRITPGRRNKLSDSDSEDLMYTLEL